MANINTSQYQYFFVPLFFVGGFFSPFFSMPVPDVDVVPMVPIVPAVPVVSVPVLPVVAVVSVVDMVPDVAELVDVTPVSVAAAVSVFTFSSFLQPKANIATASRTTIVSERDFFNV
jgi:hypothetical protein